MKVVGIIAEYNPFHNGHQWQVMEARSHGATHVVAVMGGNFLQRGAPALVDKHIRTEMALCSGVDLVLELPLPYACATAERFAYGGVALLEALGCVKELLFGSETGDIEQLQELAKALDAPETAAALSRELDKGETFAVARQRAVGCLLGETKARLLETPNNILGIEYILQLQRQKSSIRPTTLQRQGADHHQQGPGTHQMASATWLRQMAEGGDWQGMRPYMPEAGWRLLQETGKNGLQTEFQRLELPLLGKLRTMTQEDLGRLPDISEGLENRIYNAVRTGTTLEDILGRAKTRRYTMARLRRILLSAWLGLEADMNRQPPPYIRVLGMTPGGAEVLAAAKATATLPVSHSLARLAHSSRTAAGLAALEAKSVDLFYLLTPNVRPCGMDYRAEVIKTDPGTYSQ